MREAIGRPQFIAAGLLLVFLAQCAWLVNRNLRSGALEAREWFRIENGLRQWPDQSSIGHRFGRGNCSSRIQHAFYARPNRPLGDCLLCPGSLTYRSKSNIGPRRGE